MCESEIRILRSKNILIVDDDQSTLNSLSKILKRKFNNVYVAKSGDEACRILDVEIIDFVLTDYEMKGGNGLELAEKLFMHYGVPFAVMSGKLDLKTALKFSNNNSFQILEKPYELEDLNALISKVEAKFLKEKEITQLLEMGESLGFIIHEITNPLTVMDFYIKKAEMFLSDKEMLVGDLKKNLDRMRDSSYKIADIISEIRGVMGSNNSKTNFEAYSLVFLKQEIENDDYIKKICYDLNLSFEGFDEQKVMMDIEQIKLLFTNLIKNTVEAIGTNQGYLTITARKEDDRVVFDLEDSGPGVTVEQQKKIFREKVTFKKNGTGFGTMLCRKIAEIHGGEIYIKNNYPMTVSFSIKK